jgi:hypothetical protein
MTNKTNPNRFATVLKFKKGVTEAQISRALNAMKDILDLPDHGYEYVTQNDTARQVKVPFRWSHIVHKYDDQYGDPVFYIP